MTHTVVSAGLTRLFVGIGLGVVKARMFATVVLVGALRLTVPASGSVPVLTDQRSTPHCARRVEEERKQTISRREKRRNMDFIEAPIRLFFELRTANGNRTTLNGVLRERKSSMKKSDSGSKLEWI